MTTSAVLKALLALAATLGIWLAPGGVRSVSEPMAPIPVYISGHIVIERK